MRRLASHHPLRKLGFRRTFLAAMTALALGCGERDERNVSSQWVEELADISAEVRMGVLDHESAVAECKDAESLLRVHEEDGEMLLTLTQDMVLALYGLESCSKESRLKQTPFLSDLIGRIDFEIRSHVHPARGGAPDEQRFEENMLHLLDELDHRVEQARVEAARLPIDNEPCVLPYRASPSATNE